ncbi:MAG: hypothetical protein ACOCYZ_03995 [Halococcoides sp.]
MTLLRPPPLEPGDRVAIVAPSAGLAAEYPHAVGRMLMGLGERGVLGAVDGVLVGRIKARSPTVERGPADRTAYRERVRSAIRAELARYAPDATTCFGVDVGHTSPIVPMPIGGRVILDPARDRIVLGEA